MSKLTNINGENRPFETLNAEDQRNYKIGDAVVYSIVAGLLFLLGFVVLTL